ncbi:MAG: sigma-70 family RNA polymerase sigma factor, partial [Candidatus Acidiferrum sp.]
ALDHLRHAHQEIALPENLPGAPVADSAVRIETRDRIRKAFHELPAKYRLVATLALIEEEPYSDIAEAVGIPESLVKVRVFRAVRILRKKLITMGIRSGATK